MIMDFLVGMVSDFLDFVRSGLDWILGFLQLDKYTGELKWLVSLVDDANYFLPVKETLLVLSMLCTFAFSMFVFWGVQKLVVLLRG